MIEGLPGYISPVFIATTFLTVGILFYAIKTSKVDKAAGNAVLFLVPFWLAFQMILSLGGFYQNIDALPPRIFAYGAFPALLLILAYAFFLREKFIDHLPLKVLTILHLIRIPVEIVLLWLYEAGQIPRAMTFEGTNFDILSGVTAPIIYFLAFRGGRINKTLLIAWNLGALVLLINIVVTAVFAFRSPIQALAFDQPNRAIMFFPFVWLPSVIVPIVLFAHIASLIKLFRGKVDGAEVKPLERTGV